MKIDDFASILLKIRHDCNHMLKLGV